MIRVHAAVERNTNTAAEEMRKQPDVEYIIVLGAHVDGTRLTLALLERTRRALQYLEDHPVDLLPVFQHTLYHLHLVVIQVIQLENLLPTVGW